MFKRQKIELFIMKEKTGNYVGELGLTSIRIYTTASEKDFNDRDFQKLDGNKLIVP